MKNYKHKIIFKLLLFKFTKLDFGATSKYKFKQNLKMSMFVSKHFLAEERASIIISKSSLA